MDPVTLIVVALAAGASTGVKDVAAGVVTDAYVNLKALARKALAGRPDGELVLARYEADPQAWERPLALELAEARAGDDRDLVEAAAKVMRLADEAGWRDEKYAVNVENSQGMIIGDGNSQSNTFYN